MRFILTLITIFLIHVTVGSQINKRYFQEIANIYNVNNDLPHSVLTTIQITNGEITSQETLDWLEAEAERQLLGCTIKAHDGTILYTPDGEGNYAALWTRDVAYMVENSIELLPPEDAKKAILYLLNGQRSDGCIPDRSREVDAEGASN